MVKWIVAGVVSLVAVIAFGFWFFPQYGVWAAQHSGEGELAGANYARQVQVVNAQANLAAQTFNAQAEVARARGLAQANNIIKTTLTDQYLQYLWIQTVGDNKNQIIYVPESANGLPFTEAGRAVATPAP